VTVRRAALLLAILLDLIRIDSAVAAEPPVIYGFAATRGDPATNPAPQIIAHPDPARVVDGRYGDKDTHRPLVVIRHDKGRVMAEFMELPANEVVFDRPTSAPPRGSLVLVFMSDVSGRLMLAGFISGGVGGELVPTP
jgi:hypothetical protein